MRRASLGDEPDLERPTQKDAKGPKESRREMDVRLAVPTFAPSAHLTARKGVRDAVIERDEPSPVLLTSL